MICAHSSTCSRLLDVVVRIILVIRSRARVWAATHLTESVVIYTNVGRYVSLKQCKLRKSRCIPLCHGSCEMSSTSKNGHRQAIAALSVVIAKGFCCN